MRVIGAAAIVLAVTMAYAISGYAPATQAEQAGSASGRDSEQTLRDGQAIFRFDTFGDEQLWTDVLRMDEVIPAVDPVTALAVGLKVDVEALPSSVIAALRAGQVNLTDPAVTIELLRLNAVVGVKGTVSETGPLTKVGVTCALASASAWMHSNYYGPTADTGGLMQNHAPTIYAYPSIDALLSGENRGGAKSRLPGAAGKIVTERPLQSA